MPATSTSTKGIQRHHTRKTNPYYFTIQKDRKRTDRYFPTEKEVKAAYDEYRAAKEQPKLDARAALAEKRERDCEVYGNTCDQEREVCLEFDKGCKARGLKAIVLNDGTLADVLFANPADAARDAYLQLQFKTTATTVKGRDGYQFIHVKGYEGMLVVCWVVDKRRAWVLDGTALHKRGKHNYKFTPGFKTESLALAKDLTMEALITFLSEGDWEKYPRTTEAAARHNLPSESHQKELRQIEGYELHAPRRYEAPREQGGKYDRARIDVGVGVKVGFEIGEPGDKPVTLSLTLVEKEVVVKLQHKWVRINGKAAGLHCKLGTRDGKDASGKQLHRAYAKEDADEYVFCWEEPGTKKLHFWRIPSEALAAHGYFKKKTGCESIYVYGPAGVGPQPDPNARSKADTWTREFYVGSYAS